jgi:hypothetical protein
MNPRIHIVVYTLFAAFLSSLILSDIWFKLIIEDRSFRSRPLLDVLGCVPYVWPFLFGGLLLSFRSQDVNIGLFLATILGLAGGLIYTQVTALVLEPGESILDYPSFYIRYFYPLFLTFFGFTVGYIWIQRRSAKQ